MQKYMQPLMEKIEQGEIDPTVIITHRLSLDDAPEGYKIFQEKKDNCVKVVMTP
jgi:threonine dehydrogenase-like Zn-dependent dehydrogenase